MSFEKKHYITTPLYYVNSLPHLGHYYTTMFASVLKRYEEQRKKEVFFLTGTDEHGQKVSEAARKNGKTEKEYVDDVANGFQSIWDQCEIQYNKFYRTTDPHHIKSVQHALQKLYDQGEIVFREYEGLYDVGSERFVKESELDENGLIAETKTKPELRKEANYWFLMSKYQEKLIKHYESNPNAIRPEHYRNEVLSFLKSQPLEDLCISRPKERLTWGVELPFDQNFVTYVWFDALLNYLVATGWPEKMDQAMWASVTHLIAKDIVKAHGVYWPTMLMALQVPVFHELRVHGYWLIGEQKMSKTVGNIVRPLDLKEKYGLEPLSYYLLREMSFGLDSTYTEEAFIQSINAYLANGVGNLVSRLMTLAVKNEVSSFDEAELTEKDQQVLSVRAEMLKNFEEGFNNLKYQNAMKAWSELVTALDLYMNDQKPWALAKDPNQRKRLEVVLGVGMNGIRSLAEMIYPVMPKASVKILESLGINTNQPDLSSFKETQTKFNLSGEVPKLFPRIEVQKN